MSDWKAVQHIEGPYWDYSARAEYLHRYREAHAANAADYLLSGDLEWALRFAKSYQELGFALDRCTARYQANKDLDTKWIGWRTSWE